MLAYKLFRRLKNGQLRSLFIGASEPRPIGEWMDSKPIEKKGFAFREGWHCCLEPKAPHLSEKGRVWCLVDVEDFEFFDRPEAQGGTWVLAKRLKIIEAI